MSLEEVKQKYGNQAEEIALEIMSVLERDFPSIRELFVMERSEMHTRISETALFWFSKKQVTF